MGVCSKEPGVDAKLIWVLAQRGIEGNEMANRYAKSATRKEQILMDVAYSKAELKESPSRR